MRLFDFGSRSIKQKQILILMLTSSMALLLASSGFVIFELLSVRQDMEQKLYNLAFHIGQSASFGYEANDHEAAQSALMAELKTDQNVFRACIYGKDGSVLAVYPDTELARFQAKEIFQGKEIPEAKNWKDWGGLHSLKVFSKPT